MPAFEPARPSRAWLGSISAGLIGAFAVLSSDADFIAAINLPDEVKALISPAAAYEAEPSLVMYTPCDIPILEGLLHQHCTADQLALAVSVTLNQYSFQRPVDLSAILGQTPICPSIAFFVPASGAEGNPIMIACSS